MGELAYPTETPERPPVDSNTVAPWAKYNLPFRISRTTSRGVPIGPHRLPSKRPVQKSSYRLRPVGADAAAEKATVAAFALSIVTRHSLPETVEHTPPQPARNQSASAWAVRVTGPVKLPLQTFPMQLRPA